MGDLKALALPLYDVVVADHALMDEATDAVKILRSRTPSGGDLARRTGEAAVVVGDKVSQDSVGGVQIGGLGEAQSLVRRSWRTPRGVRPGPWPVGIERR